MVNVSTSVHFRFSDEEKEILVKAKDILKTARHDWWVQDSNCDEHEMYWQIDTSIELLDNLI